MRYLAHDLGDPAVARRMAMLRAGGACAAAAGFHRAEIPAQLSQAVVLGRTFDADLGQRARAVARWLLRPACLARLARNQDIIMARNLEMLLIAATARRLGAPKARLVYECLDIHAALLGSGLKSKLLRALEARLLRRVDRLVVSSPAFLQHHFSRYGRLPPATLVENRLLRLDIDPAPESRACPEPGPPWRIGWFGMIRCRRSLDLLTHLAAQIAGQVEIIIRGRPTEAVFPDFVSEIAARPGLRFEGAYRPEDLAGHYAQVHFVWAIDFYEEGQNSAWLLPNRLYEGVASGRPILALAGVETGRWVVRHKAGIVFDNLETDLAAFFRELTPQIYQRAAASAASVPDNATVCRPADCVAFVEALSS